MINTNINNNSNIKINTSKQTAKKIESIKYQDINNKEINVATNNYITTNKNDVEEVDISFSWLDSLRSVLQFFNHAGIILENREKTLENAISVFFNSNGIKDITVDDIRNVEVRDDIGKVYFTMNDGSEYNFDKYSGKIVYYKNNDIEIHYAYGSDIGATQKEYIYNTYGLDLSVPINFIAYANINGKVIPYYSIGENNRTDFASTPVDFSKHFSNFPSDVLESITQVFRGIFLGDEVYSTWPEGDYGAFVSGTENNRYMFIPDNFKDTPTGHQNHVPYHEITHILYSSDYPIDYDKLEELFEKYNTNLQALKDRNLGYTNSGPYPNDNEFLADATASYYLYAEDLKNEIPELYNFLDSIFGKSN